MALKVNLIYNQFSQGFTETFYLPGPTDPRSFCLSLSATFTARAMAFRASGTQLYAVRASVVGGTRQSYTRLIQRYAPGADIDDPPDYTNPDVVSTDAVYQLLGSAGHKRNISFRGLRDADVIRLSSGAFAPSAALTSQIQSYVNILSNTGLAIRFEVRPPTNPLVWYTVTSVTTAAANSPLTNLEISSVPFAFTVPVPVTIQGIPRDDLPGLPRNAVCVGTGTAPNVITIQYRYRASQTTTFPLKMRVTQTQYSYDTLDGTSNFVRFGERKTGRPFGGSVGRARVAIRRF